MDCNNLESVIIEKEKPVSINDGTFPNRSNATLYIPFRSKTAYEAADYWKEFKEIVEMALTNCLYGMDTNVLTGKQAVLPIELVNKDKVKLCQFDLRLPDGVTVATKVNDKLDVKLTERAENHSISSRHLANGDYRFVISSMDNDSFVGNNGSLVEVTIDVADTMDAGEYIVKVLNVELSVPDGNDLRVVRPADTESILTVKTYTPGDVNNDGSVSVTDVGCAINYILEQVPSVFVFEAADMNGDKSVSVTDVGIIINLILNDGVTSAESRVSSSAMTPMARYISAFNCTAVIMLRTFKFAYKDNAKFRLSEENTFNFAFLRVRIIIISIFFILFLCPFTLFLCLCDIACVGAGSVPARLLAILYMRKTFSNVCRCASRISQVPNITTGR